MVSFESDYIQGAHEKIIEALTKTNRESLSGYGTDKYTLQAIDKIRQACKKNVDVTFLVGGTPTNKIVISTLLKPYEGVMSAFSGHVSMHEAGAIENSGHKVLTLPHHLGKIDPDELKDYIETFYNDGNHEHMVFPGMVYISHPTEYGTLYSKQELEKIYRICQNYDIPLFIDGARLGYGLMSPESDMTLEDISNLCDVFYIGGTKVGALLGEAVIFTKKAPEHFMTIVKLHGGLLAKGRLLGIQFDTLFTDNLYFDISKHAIDMSLKLKDILMNYNIPFFMESPTNQQFVILENNFYKELSKHVGVSFWEKYDDMHTVVRFATSWSTTQKDLDELDKVLKDLA